MKKKILLTVVGFAVCSFGDLSLYPMFCVNAVLQRDVPLNVWGNGSDGKTVMLSFAGQTVETVVSNGQWRVTLDPVSAGGPYSMDVVCDDERIVRSGMLMGDVWLCAGQSNMEAPIRYFLDRLDRSDEKVKFFHEVLEGIPETCTNSNIRFIKVMQTVREEPINESMLGSPQWQTCSPWSVQELSATAYFFARRLQPEIGVPVGLIVDAISGTPAQAWVPWSVLDSKPLYAPIRQYYEEQLKTYPARKQAYEDALAQFREEHGMEPGAWVNGYLPGAPKAPYGPEHHQRPTGLYNGMIAPLAGMKFKGVIWYQGEGNAQSLDTVDIYRELFPDLIQCWRSHFQCLELPFLYVQLAAFSSPISHDTVWPAMRAVQANVEKTVPNTAMAVAIDGGLEHDIHPPFKPQVGDRLAQAALVNVYGKSGPAGGPQVTSIDFEPGRVVVHFSRTGEGLVARGIELGLFGKYKLAEGELSGFELAGSDGVFAAADAVIDSNSVVVHSDSVSIPTSVRYAWRDFPLANLYNKDGFPTAPFSVSKP